MFIVFAILALAMGAILGLLGGGGSILTVPILAYVAMMPAGQAVAASLVVVAVTSAVGAVMHARSGSVEWRTGLIFGSVAMVGAYGGGRLAIFFPGWLLLALFSGMMIATSLLMLRKRESADVTPTSSVGPVVIGFEGLIVGAATGLVGAGGGFLVVPALALLGGLGMRQAIATSLLVIAMKSSAGVLGHLSHVDIDWTITGLVTVFAVLGSLIGAKFSARIPAESLRTGFAWFVLLMGAAILGKELSSLLGSVAVAMSISGPLVLLVIAVFWWRSRRLRGPLLS